MSEPLYMGIDGGGSTLRVVVCDGALNVGAAVKRGTANPNLIGLDESATLIQATMQAALANAPGAVVAVGAGVAGAYGGGWLDWLAEVIGAALPGALVAAVPDPEIAMVGALGQTTGALLLAGTGSAAYGVNAADERLLVGGWGYLLGDEGSGYWLGREALRAVTIADDRGEPDPFAGALLTHLGITKPRELVSVVYGAESLVPTVAALAPFVLAATDDHPTARRIVAEGAAHLANAAQTVTQRLGLNGHEISFAGSLLTHDNALSRQVYMALGLPERPIAKHPPDIGAALLARLRYEAAN